MAKHDLNEENSPLVLTRNRCMESWCACISSSSSSSSSSLFAFCALGNVRKKSENGVKSSQGSLTIVLRPFAVDFSVAQCTFALSIQYADKQGQVALVNNALTERRNRVGLCTLFTRQETERRTHQPHPGQPRHHDPDRPLSPSFSRLSNSGRSSVG